MGADFDYAAAFESLDLDAVKAKYGPFNDRGGYIWRHMAEVDADVTALLTELAKVTAELADAQRYGYEMAGKVTDLCRDMGKVKRERDAARHDAEYWKGKYEGVAMDRLAAAPQAIPGVMVDLPSGVNYGPLPPFEPGVERECSPLPAAASPASSLRHSS